MGTILTCGPFAATESNGKAQIIFPLNTNGDWVGTPEGQEQVKKAVQSLNCACDEGLLPETMEVEFRNDDQAIVRIPMESHVDAMMKGAGIKETVAKVTGATVTEMARKIG